MTGVQAVVRGGDSFAPVKPWLAEGKEMLDTALYGLYYYC
jgi:hypothetical protein